MTPNTHPDTGIPFGIIRADAVDADKLDDLLYKYGENITYRDALADHLAGLMGVEGYDENEATQEFADSYECDEPVIEGTHQGAYYRTTWLGGALMLWIFDSTVLTRCQPCGPCCPNAGDLDSVGDYLAYGVPADWLSDWFLREKLEDFDSIQRDGDRQDLAPLYIEYLQEAAP